MITGNNNILNNGSIEGDCINGDKISTTINITYMLTENQNDDRLKEAIEALNNITKSQAMILETILKQKENDNQQNEALIILARAAENNSKATVNLSESVLKEKEIKILLERFIQAIENINNK